MRGQAPNADLTTRSRSEPVLAKNLYSRRLRTLVAHFLGEGHTRADGETRKCVVQNAVALEVDFLSVTGLEETKFAGRIKPHDCSNGLPLVLLHLSLGAANMILELPAGVLESIIDCERQIGMPLVGRRSPSYIRFAAVRQGEANMDLVKSALVVMLVRALSGQRGKRLSDPTVVRVRRHASRSHHGLSAFRSCLGIRSQAQFACGAPFQILNCCRNGGLSEIQRRDRSKVSVPARPSFFYLRNLGHRRLGRCWPPTRHFRELPPRSMTAAEFEVPRSMPMMGMQALLATAQKK